MHLLSLKFPWSPNPILYQIIASVMISICFEERPLWWGVVIIISVSIMVRCITKKNYAGLVRCNIYFFPTVYAWPICTKFWVVFHLVAGFPFCWLNLLLIEIAVGCYWLVASTYSTFRLILSCCLLLDFRKQRKRQIQHTSSDFCFLSVWCPQQ